MRQIFVDFEFSEIVEPKVKLVCAGTYDAKTGEKKKWWLHKSPKMQEKLSRYLRQFDLVTAYSAIAECRSYSALGLDPLKFNWIDLFLEWRCLTNHNDNLQWGKQLVNGRVKNTRKPPPKWERTEEDAATGFKATHSLAEATYKLTGQIRDTKHKTKMRDLIISNPDSYTEEERQAIMSYCLEDVVFLPQMKKRMIEEYKKLIPEFNLKELTKEMMWRGRYSAHTSIMENKGYPIDVKKTKNFSSQVGIILFELQREINRLFPDVKPFYWNKAEKKFSWDQKRTKAWIKENHDEKKWMKTDGGKKKIKDLSLSLEAWEKFYDFKHDYPKNNFGAQMVRFLKTKQSLYGFSSSKDSKRKNFWDSVGSDGRVRAYLNIYGAQSSRSQPGATGFMFLKPAWMRALVVPAKGKFMGGIDFGSQEFFLSALESQDENMIEAYLSGDPYFAFAKISGQVPQNGKRENYESIRNACKSTVLGISYLMTKYGLAIKLTNDTGEEWDEDRAQEQIDLFYESFEDLEEFQSDIIEKYQDEGFIKLPCVGAGTKILTENGLINIEDIKQEKVWDGCEWAEHGGLVSRGEKVAILVAEEEIIATPDHWLLKDRVWRAALEVREDTSPRASEKFSADGRLLARRSGLKGDAVSLVAAYAELKKMLELKRCNLAPLQPVLTALNLSGLSEGQSPKEIATFLMTSIFGENGKLVTITQKKGAKILAIPSSKGMELGVFNSVSTTLEASWNTLLHWMGIGRGKELWTELIMTETMSVETYELCLSQLTTKTRVYDLLHCGERNRFQAGKVIAKNCGWYMWGDNPNHRSVANMRIQGFGASIMRKAVDLAVAKGIYIPFTLHDALYMEGDIGEEWKMEVLRDCMREAFIYYLPEEYKEIGAKIKLDPFVWSQHYKRDSEIVVGKSKWKVPASDLYIDSRSLPDYLKFSPYFEVRPEQEL